VVSNIPPVPDEPDEPEWLKSKGTVKLSSLPATTIPVLDATVAVATVAATLPSVTESPPSATSSHGVADGPAAEFFKSPLVPSLSESISEQALPGPVIPDVGPNYGLLAVTPLAVPDTGPGVAIPLANAAVMDPHASEPEAVAGADHRSGAAALPALSPPPSAEPGDAPDEDEAPPRPEGPLLEPDPVALDEFDVTAPVDADAASNSIAENAAAGTKVGITASAFDADATTSGVTYSLANDGGGRFAIDAVTGEVSVAAGASFDRESESAITVVVTATSQDGSASTQSFAIAVTDVDEFDVTPVSDSNATANAVTENAAIGTAVGITAFASDGDATTNGVTYALTDDAGGRFAIDATTGVVTVAGAIDREAGATQAITVRATSADGSTTTQSYTITINDVDEFDVTPVSDSNAVANAVTENAAIGTTVGITAFASDGDATNSGVTYALTDDAGGRFAIDATTGVVTVAGAIDREAGATQAITVRATSADGSTATQTYSIAVTDVDEFDVSPVSDSNAAANAVTENAAIGTTVGITAFASDGDATNSGVTYSLANDAGGRFAIDATTGVVTVAGAIDREAGATQAITVRATSADGSTATQSYTIAINDADEFDVTPVGDSNATSNSIAENAAAGTKVGITAFASDGDATTSGITYSLANDGGGRFVIDAATGEVSVAAGASFDRESESAITVAVTATSQDGSVSTQSFAIAVTDVDEFDVTAPVDADAATNSIAENAAAGTKVGITGFASDGDATTSGITYSLANDAGGRFVIDAATGEVSVAAGASFDRESESAITVAVTATSQDGSASTQSFAIAVTDVDEFDVTAPVDTDAAANSIAENAAAGTKVGITASAFDADATTSGVTYSLANDGGGRFAIDAVTGEVSVAAGASFDRESESAITVVVTATSQDGSASTQSFAIAVTDVDEFDVTAPVDTDAAANSIAENAAAGTKVGITGFASDGDATTSGITYSLANDAGGRFVIDAATGEVSVAAGASFDRESESAITVAVTATSQDGSASTQSFAIAVTDVDEFDVTPVSDSNAAANAVTENAAIGTTVGITGFASDGDATNSGVTYALTDNAGGRFAIDATTGVVTVAGAIDREAGATQAITVRATSADGSTTTQSYSIAVGDVDEFDVTPVADSNAAANAVTENAAIGTTVGITAFASDGDATTNGITYALTDDAGGRFAIDAATGVVTVAGAIDREAGATQAIIVRATSADGSTATQTYSIAVGDADEFDVTPVSDSNAAANAVTENAAIGTTVGITAFASDGDATTNGVTYSLTDNAGGRFAIDATTGVVTVAGAIDREAGATQAITVRATSADGSTATQTYSIAVGDADEFDVTAPVDTDAAANAVTENAAIGTTVGITAFASDGDATTNGVTYALTDDAGGRFAIDATTGVVTVAGAIDREAGATQAITVRATSADGSTATQSYSIAVTDVDEFDVTAPVDADVASNSIAENAAAGTTVGITAFASDGDATTNGITYALTDDAGGRFAIDATTGVVTVAGAIDREAGATQAITVRATSADGSTTTQSYSIAVGDVDEFDVTPVADSNAAANAVTENAAIGTTVGITAFASDGDATTNGITYALTDDAGGRFAIDAATGVVTVAGAIDREAGATQAIIVRATSADGSTATQTYSIAVGDADEFDVTPVSDSNAAANAVTENAAIGTTVGITAFASDGDATTNGVTYSLTDNAGGRFAIDATTGVVTVAGAIDREAGATQAITVRATSADGSTATQTYSIAVGDADEFDVTAPVDTDAAANAVTENAAIGTTVGITAFASDGDATNSGVTYALTDDAGGRFAIDATTGVVTVAGAIDREAGATQAIIVRATSADGSTATQTYSIAVGDADEFDVTPVSDSNAAANAVTENAAIGTTVGITAFASDGDATTNGITYSLTDDAGGRFAIDAATGVVTVAGAIDREAGATQAITVRATSADGSTATQTYSIAVGDADEFDVSPVADSNAAADAVTENAAIGTTVGVTAFASDGDAGNSGVTYALTDDAGGRFAIDATTGVVTVAGAIDREAGATQAITVRATSADGSTATQSYTIAINDADEFDVTAPVDADAATNSIAENAAAGTKVGITGFASDGDATNSGVTYSLTDDAGGRFVIDAATGEVSVAAGASFDRESESAITVAVTATSEDGSASTQSFAIAVTDVDEFDVTAPVDADAAANSIAENAAAGTKVGITGLASDGDATTSGITYSLANDGGGRFVIDAATGEVSVAAGASFDRESESAITVAVTATSQDGSASTQSFAIAVTDVDEFDVTAPVDVDAAANSIAENAAAGTKVGITGFASDGDATTSGVTYSLANDGGGRFVIDAATGEVSVAAGASFDRESESAITVVVTATSQDGSASAQSFAIAVTDVDEFDVSPVTDSNAAANAVTENAAIGTTVGVTAFASDGDATNSGVTYALTDDAGGRFAIDATTGVVTVAGAIDREAGATQAITVRATSADGSTATQSYTITINDVDEFDVTAPVDADVASNSIAENAAAGTKVGITGFASDGDATTSGITYSLANDGGGRFVIDAATGEVSVAAGASFDRESESAITVAVTATSQDGSASTQSFAIAVTDVDEFDVTPVSDSNAAANAVTENAAIGTTVGITAFASDGDATTNGVTYSLTDDAGGRFAIDATTGVVTVAGAIDREAGATRSITVTATSQDGSTATQSYTITINDADEFDVTPVGDSNAAANAVTENAAIGTTVGITAFASDGDATNSGVTYALTDDAGGRFAIDATTGVVTVAGAIDREAGATQAITVTATSADGSTATQSYTIAINDVDEFDVTAVTDSNAAANAVTENAAIGTVVGITAFASDGDATNSGVTYALTDNAGGRFAIDATTGVVTVAGAIDREAGATQAITVRATSADGSTATQSYSIAVGDVDEFDVTPVGDSNAAANAVTENAAIGTVVGITAFASDGDATNSGVTYALTDNAGGRFAIDATTGVVTVAGAIDREAGATQAITVRATSADGSTATQSYSIAVTDVDEFDVTPVSDSNAAANAVTENAAIGTTVGITAFASDGDATNSGVTYALTDDAGGRFAIDATTGVVTVAGAIDREAGATQAITVTATSADGSTATQSYSIAVTDVDEFDVTPVSDSNAAANAVTENAAIGTTVGITAFASDGDATTNGVTYALTDDAGGRFAIDATTGVVTVAGAIDREAGATQAIIVRATSADGSTATQSYSIAVGDADEFDVTPVADSNAAANAVTENAAIGTTVGITAFASDGDATNSGVTYALTDNAGGRFAIDATTGVVTVAGALNFETSASHAITVRATSADGSTASQTFNIGVNDLNDETPTNISLASTGINEERTGKITFTLAGEKDVDPPLVEVFANGVSLGIVQLTNAHDTRTQGFGDLSDLEAAAQTFTLNLPLGVTDPGSISFRLLNDSWDPTTGYDTNFYVRDVTVGSTSLAGSQGTGSPYIFGNWAQVNSNDAPISFAPPSGGWDTRQIAGTLSATDADASNSFTYTLTSDPSGLFEISGDKIIVKPGLETNFEAATSHTVTVQVNDGAGHTFSRVFTIAVNNINEAPTDIAFDGNSSLATTSGGTLVGPQAADHPDLMVGFALDEGTGTTAASLNGGATLTLLNGAGWTSAPVGSAINLAGGTTNAGAQAQLTPFAHSGAISVSMYARMDNVDGGTREWQRLFDFGNTNNTINGGQVFNTDDMRLEVIVNGTYYSVVAADAIQDGEWAHWSFTVSETGVMRIYKDGLLLAEAQGATPVLDGNGVYRLGASSFGGDDSLDGAIADVTIHRDDLTAAEVAQLANNSSIGLTASTAIATVSSVSSPVAGDTFTFSLTDNAGGVFTIDASTGEISLSSAYDVPGGVPEFVASSGSLNPFNGIDQGTDTNPHLVDIDNDGDLDLFVGRDNGGLAFYRNTGTSTTPTYVFVQHNPFTLNSNATDNDPTFVDIDNDGDMDAFVSDISGSTQYFRNVGTAANPSFAAAVTNPFGLADAGSYTAITFADLDGDGDSDAIIGDDSGNLDYFRNTGTASSPAFTYIGANPFGLADVGTYAAPDFADFDNDGDLDGLVGRSDGQFVYFENIGTATAPSFVATTNPFGLIDIGAGSNVDAGDIDGDGDLDLLVGRSDGTIAYFTNVGGHSGTVFSDTVTVRVTGSSGESYSETIGIHLGTERADTITGTALSDIIYGLGQTGDTLSGGGGDDSIYGSDGNDQISGGDGNDMLVGNGGSDAINGGAGIDTVDYSASSAGVTINLATGAAGIGGDAQGDTLVGIENVTGSAFADTLVGNADANSFRGGNGDDTLTGGGGSDWFTLAVGDDRDSISGGTGGGWIDTIEMEGMAPGTFTLELDSGASITSQNASEIILSADASGRILYGNGDRVDFSGIERITW
jgi:protocadherin Fat 4